ncbi:hypothetical protein MPLDJ20_70243 [Mesorhizobium plurifarium]|uniref:Uncharacterized protein n=1 Tax=Mesorhizobium plurifarium TaxID=69974 RepID=A0A090GRB0_MESPL|nr:hypothetical protein MPLDJ20_70243 [Mesorhizobium plurifarium]
MTVSGAGYVMRSFHLYDVHCLKLFKIAYWRAVAASQLTHQMSLLIREWGYVIAIEGGRILPKVARRFEREGNLSGTKWPNSSSVQGWNDS